jgi:hypothetical protein
MAAAAIAKRAGRRLARQLARLVVNDGSTRPDGNDQDVGPETLHLRSRQQERLDGTRR